MRWFANIDGAIVYPDVEIINGDRWEDDLIKMPSEPNEEYKYALLTDECAENEDFNMILVSKDRKNFVFAIVVFCGGKQYSARDFNTKDFTEAHFDQ